mmetsp:Transcript_32848/g.76701  ORF Transcript_32848/g.76701 Transcript_32848/m.76701 type:complete len:266 (-) Transcript_32848:374-1171(-)
MSTSQRLGLCNQLAGTLPACLPAVVAAGPRHSASTCVVSGIPLCWTCGDPGGVRPRIIAAGALWNWDISTGILPSWLPTGVCRGVPCRERTRDVESSAVEDALMALPPALPPPDAVLLFWGARRWSSAVLSSLLILRMLFVCRPSLLSVLLDFLSSSLTSSIVLLFDCRCPSVAREGIAGACSALTLLPRAPSSSSGGGPPTSPRVAASCWFVRGAAAASCSTFTVSPVCGSFFFFQKTPLAHDNELSAAFAPETTSAASTPSLS